jgi:glycosyltransferase involved in cell wall biosynthesis
LPLNTLTPVRRLDPDVAPLAINRRSRKVAYLVSRFPVVTETFILREILELERHGTPVEIFSLLHQREAVMHEEARPLLSRVCYGSLGVLALLRSHLHYFIRRPRQYLRVWWAAIRGNLKSAEFLTRAVYVLLQAPRFARKMEEAGVEHVHAHWATHPALAAFVIRRLTGLPYSFTAHAHDLYVQRAMLGEKLREASFVVTISAFNRRLLTELYGPEIANKTAVVHCGVDPSSFASPRVRMRRAGSEVTFLCVASLRDYKGHRYLIDACTQLAEQHLPFRCLLVGEGEERPNLETLIQRRGLEDRVKLLGAQPQDRVRELLRACDAVVLPSVVTDYGKMEGIPVALMEALAAERPVVATRISGIPELVEDGVTGLLVPERDPLQLSRALQRIAHEPLLGSLLASAGRRKVMRQFNLSANTEALVQLFSHDWSQGPPPLIPHALEREEQLGPLSAIPASSPMPEARASRYPPSRS